MIGLWIRIGTFENFKNLLMLGYTDFRYSSDSDERNAILRSADSIDIELANGTHGVTNACWTNELTNSEIYIHPAMKFRGGPVNPEEEIETLIDRSIWKIENLEKQNKEMSLRLSVFDSMMRLFNINNDEDCPSDSDPYPFIARLKKFRENLNQQKSKQ